ncbi:MAG: T9SS type A sorting domain-containing protein [Flavobacteriales bacterium]
MKKSILSVLALLSAGMLSAQTGPVKRTILIEEGTNASCGPCASQNPTFNAGIVEPNWNTKLIAIKYQAWWPGYDPMNEQNPDEIKTRINYYGFSGVPTAILNGRIPNSDNTTGGNWTPAGSWYAGAPGGFAQAVITNEYSTNLTSFTMSTTHMLSEDYDSVYLTVTIQNVDTVAFTGGSMKLRVALVEDDITYPSAPGTNGEKTFEHVMRKMIPNATGTSIDNNWSIGQDTVITIGAAIPSYVYRYDQIALVAWLQDDTGKEVWQCSYSEPVEVDGLDVSLALNGALDNDLCAESVAPEVKITNLSNETVTSVVFSTAVNGGTPSTETFTGSIAAGSSAVHTLSAISLDAGSTNQIVVTVKSVNGGLDLNKMNDMLEIEATRVDTDSPQDADFEYDFEGLDFTEIPNHMYGTVINDIQWGALTNTNTGESYSAGGFEESEGAFFWNFYGYPNGAAALTTDPIEFENVASAKLLFALAYAQQASENDELMVEASTDCGENWTELFKESGDDLATTDPVSGDFFFPDEDGWKKITVDASVLFDTASSVTVMLRFTGTGDGGNLMYIDDIHMTTTTVGVEEVSTSGVVVYPNPATSVLNISGVEGLPTVVKLFDMQGRLVQSSTVNNTSVSVEHLDAGVYTVSIENAEVSVSQKLTIVK